MLLVNDGHETGLSTKISRVRYVMEKGVYLIQFGIDANSCTACFFPFFPA